MTTILVVGGDHEEVQALRRCLAPIGDFEVLGVDDELRGLEELGADRPSPQCLVSLGDGETHFALANDLALIEPLTAYFYDSMERLGFGDEGLRSQVGIALMEAVANAMVHGNLEIGSAVRRRDRDAYDALVATRQQQQPYRSRRVKLHAVQSPAEVCFTIVDEGPGFDPGSIPDPTAVENLLAASGRGMMLMRAFMDTVEYGPEGNRVTMCVSNPAPSV